MNPKLFSVAMLTAPAGLLLVFASAVVKPVQSKAPAIAHPAGQTSPKPYAAIQSTTKLSTPDPYPTVVRPLFKQFCYSCHSGATPTAGIDLSKYATAAEVLKARDVWDKVSTNVSENRMPPVGALQPSATQRSAMASWVETTVSLADCNVHDPGRVTLRRLNRAEYNNTVRDLLGTTLRPADDFPSDDVGSGFDDIGDVLSMSPLLMEKYMDAAAKLASAAVVVPEDVLKPVRIDAAHLGGHGVTAYATAGGRILLFGGDLTADLPVSVAGEYVVRVRAAPNAKYGVPPQASITLDGSTLRQVNLDSAERKADNYQVRLHLVPGKHTLTVAMLPFPGSGARTRGPGATVDYVDLVGPVDKPFPAPASQNAIIFQKPTPGHELDCAKIVLKRLASRAFRRPATDDEVDRLAGYVQMAESNGEGFERGIQIALQAILVSPSFLFHVELDARPNDPAYAHAINDYELASRLSYFLWSSMPDDQLFALAAKRTLHNPAVLQAQTQRMLMDHKATALADNFAGQWLEFRNLAIIAPDKKMFPDFNNALRADMRTETEMFFETVETQNRSILDFVDGRYTYLNADLARHYGIAGVSGEAFRKVSLSGTERSGVLTQASVLTITSNPTRTSPVKRGKWVLEQFLGTPPPPPPPNVPPLDGKGGPVTGTLRQRMEEHRKNPVCAQCHARMDPLGFGLENYDAVGRWRARDGSLPIDARGKLVSGETFNGPAGLKAILLRRKTQFATCVADKMMTYALGRSLKYFDKCGVNALVQHLSADNYRFWTLVNGIVQSDSFRQRRGDGGSQS